MNGIRLIRNGLEGYNKEYFDTHTDQRSSSIILGY